MPIVQMPDGSLINFEDGTPPDVIERYKAQHPARANAQQQNAAPQVSRDEMVGRTRNTLMEAASAGTASPEDIQRAVADGTINEETAALLGLYNRGSGDRAFTNSAMRGLTFGLNDEIEGGVSALFGGDYQTTANARRRQNERDQAEHPLLSVGGNVIGAVANPLGTGARALQLAGKALPVLGRAGGFIASRSIPTQAAIAGFNQGAAQGFGNADGGDRLQGALRGGVEGGIGGGLFGSAIHGARRGWQTVRDARASQAPRAAYSRIADALEGSTPPARYGPNIDPALRAQREIAASLAGGTDTMLADLSPGLQAMAARSARRPEIPASNTLIQRSEERAAARPAAMENQIIQRLDDNPTGVDAMAAQAANTGARRAHGAANYDAVLDRPLQWNPELEQWASGAGPSTQRALRRSYDIMLDQRLNPAEHGFTGEGVFTHIPNMRTFDYVKRGFDGEIGTALRAGDRDAARRLSDELSALKQGIGKSNPEYLAVLAKQRDFFQRDAALELGRSVPARLTGNRADPRVLLNEINSVKAEDYEMLRTGFADALMSLRDTRTGGKGPIAVLQSMMASPNQRKVLEGLFGGRGNLGRFERWLRRELRAGKTDAMVSGPQSITSLMQGVQQEGGTSVAAAGLRGYGFGGVPGAVSNTIQAITQTGKNLTTSKAVQEQMARILMGDGSDLASGVASAREFDMLRRARNRNRAVGSSEAIAAILAGGY